MKVVHKFKLDRFNKTEIDLPNSYKVVLAGIQNDEPHIWVEYDANYTKQKHSFSIYPTGFGIPKEYKHIASFVENGGQFVWHVYWD